MKRFSLSVLALILLTTPVWAAEALTIVADNDFAPYSMMIEGQPAGIDVEVLTEAARRADIDLNIVLKPWEELVSMVKNGECDGAAALFRTPEREKYALFMDAVPVHLSDYVIFTKIGNTFVFKSCEDLRGKVIGVVTGISLGDEFEAAKADGIVQVRDYPEIIDAVRGLLDGEIDGFVGNIDVTYYQLKPMGMTSSIMYLPKKIVEDKPAYVVLSRGSALKDKAQVARRIEHALNQMKLDGTYNTIAKRYLFRF